MNYDTLAEIWSDSIDSYAVVQQKVDINNNVSFLEAERIHFSFTT